MLSDTCLMEPPGAGLPCLHRDPKSQSSHFLMFFFQRVMHGTPGLGSRTLCRLQFVGLRSPGQHKATEGLGRNDER